ncbi:hypothetical protein FPOA_03717 [Fusarium poae]|uniref:Uncharacterized protein n=1 Tax=Fusarium poae TaxID=36050 RepID=A0A1B8AS33_FUSPO|nr:hypothetical protein FPOA_03717 [Fusarium poae]
MAKPKTSDWIKYYAKYTHVKVKRFGMYSLIWILLPCTCGMSLMISDNAPWWNLPKKPGQDVDKRPEESAGEAMDPTTSNT